MSDLGIFATERGSMRNALGLLVDVPPRAMGEDFVVLRCVLPAGTTTMLLKHQDRVAMVALSYGIVSWWGGNWRNHMRGEVVEFSPWALYGFRNVGGADAALLLITTSRIANFLSDVAELCNSGLPDETRRRMEGHAVRYGVRLCMAASDTVE